MGIVTRAVKGSALTYGELDGNFTALDNRTAVAWQNLSGDMVTDGIPNAPPMRLFNSTMYMRAFSPDTEQEVSCMFHMPKHYVAGTDTWPHGHAVTPTASSGTVRWKITMSYAREEEVFSAPYTFYVEELINTTDQNKHKLMEVDTPMSIPNLSPDSIVMIRVARDATHINDTYPDEIYLSQIDLYYRAQGFGEDIR